MSKIGNEIGSIKLTINSNLEDIHLVGLAVTGICSSTTLTKEEVYEVELCLVEAMTNAVKHAYKYQPDHEMDTLVALFEDRMVIKVCDEGPGMESFSPPKLDFNPADRKSLPDGKLGLPIMFYVMDEVSYHKGPEKNVLTMTKLLKENKT